MIVQEIHTIQKVFVTVNTKSEKVANRYKNSIESFLEAAVFPVIENYFDSLVFDSNEVIYQIPKLSFELSGLNNHISLDNERAKQEIKIQLLKKLKETLSTSKNQQELKVNRTSISESKMASFFYFLEKGTFPWWDIDTKENKLSKKVLFEITENENFETQFLKSLQEIKIKQRLINQFFDEELELLFLGIYNKPKGLKEILSAISKSKEFFEETRELVWFYVIEGVLKNDLIKVVQTLKEQISLEKSKESDLRKNKIKQKREASFTKEEKLRFEKEKRHLESVLIFFERILFSEKKGKKIKNDLEVNYNKKDVFLIEEKDKKNKIIVSKLKQEDSIKKEPIEKTKSPNKEIVVKSKKDKGFLAIHENNEKNRLEIKEELIEGREETKKMGSLSEQIRKSNESKTIKRRSQNTLRTTKSIKKKERSIENEEKQTIKHGEKKKIKPIKEGGDKLLEKTILTIKSSESKKEKNIEGIEDKKNNLNKREGDRSKREKKETKESGQNTSFLSKETMLKKESYKDYLKLLNTEITEKENSMISQKFSCIVENAGLILLHPFLKQFFNTCGFLNKENEFIKPIEAVHLLHYVATKREKQLESNLVFEKFLCNVPIDYSIPRNVILSENLKEKSEELLNAVIRNWESLKGSSTDLIRNEFLQRPGKLEFKKNIPNITIEKKTQDILLNKLSWNISMCKLSWMDTLIFTNW